MRCREREDLAVAVNLKVEAARMEEDGGAVTVLMVRRGGRRGWRRRLPWRVEGEEKIRVRVLGDEDDDVAESDWLIW